MSVTKRSALDILPTHPHFLAICKQTRVSQQLAGCPIHFILLLQQCMLVLQKLLNFFQWFKPFRNRHDGFKKGFELSIIYCGRR